MVAKKNTKAKAVETKKPARKLTSDAQRESLLKNGVPENEIPEFAQDAMFMMDKIFAEQRKRRAGRPTDGQVKYLIEQMGYSRKDAMTLFTYGEASMAIFKNKEARKPKSA